MSAEKTVFLDIMGDSPVMRVLDFLIINEEFDYSMTDIAEQSKVGYSTLKLFWKRLEEHKLVKQTRAVGKARMFTLNDANPSVNTLRELYWQITRKKVRQALKNRRKETLAHVRA